MKKYIIALFIGCSVFVHGQNGLSGSIVDAHKIPLKDVVVSLDLLHKSTVTDENGRYEFKNLPYGTISISFTLVGYANQHKTLNLQKGGAILDVVLLETVFQMDEVIVSTAFNKIQSQNVMKVEHSSIRELQKKGGTTLMDGLATIPGVSQISTGTSIGKPVIRGLSGNRVLVYSQGVRMENQQFGDEHGLGLNDEGVESVEVIKGPASLLYGSDALGGVLYLNPEKFANEGTFTSNISQRFFSNTLGSNTSLVVKTSLDGWKFILRGTHDTHSDYKIAQGQRVSNSRYQESDIKTGVGYSNSKFSTVFRYNYNELDLGIPENGLGEQNNSKKTEFPKQGVYNHLFSLNNTLFFEKSKLDVNLGYIANDRNEFEDSAIAILQMKLNTINYDAKYYLPKWGKIETILGVQGMHQTNNNYGQEQLIPDAKTTDFGVFGTGLYEWNSNAIQAGIRFDNRNILSQGQLGENGETTFAALDKSYQSFNASLGYKTKLIETLSLRLHLASGFRAPNLAELTSNGVHEGTNRYEIGEPHLKTEQNVQSDINLEYKSSHFEFFASAFYNHINNYIYAAATGENMDEEEVYKYVQDNAGLYGGEVGLHFHPHPLDWMHYESSFSTVNGKKDDGLHLPLIPANNWINTLRAEFGIDNWLEDGFASFTIATTFDQDKVSAYETSSDGYTLLNLGLGGKFNLGKFNFSASLNGNNLLDKKYTSHLSRLKTDGIPNIGRNIVLGFNFTIL